MCCVLGGWWAWIVPQACVKRSPIALQIADFGLSNLFCDDKYLQTFCGSPLYASPEIVNGRPYRGPEVDSWSLGVLLYTMVHGSMPFDGQDYKNLVRQISTGNYRKPLKPSGTGGASLPTTITSSCHLQISLCVIFVTVIGISTRIGAADLSLAWL